MQKPPYFNGSQLSLVDTAFAPLFMRLDIIAETNPAFSAEHFPRVAAWSDALRSLSCVQRSVVPEFKLLYEDFMRSKRGFLAGRLVS